MTFPWQRPLGARPVGEGRVEFRVWAPAAEAVAVALGGREHPLEDEGHGVRAGVVDARPGDDYRYVLDGRDGRRELADPCSRAQPAGVLGPSSVVDPTAFRWTDDRWGGVRLRDLVIYELHVGTFTAEGTFDAAAEHLGRLADLGVTAIEVMPIATFPGDRGWGYDGLYLWAPHPAYGGPAGFARLVDAAHAAGLAVILDVVYNHVGSPADQLSGFGPYFTGRYSTFWGDAINYDDAGSDPVREWAIQNAAMWVGEFHVDGLRIDAVHAIFDLGARHVLEEMGERVRAVRPRAFLIAESGLNDPRVIRPVEVGGWGLDAQWADDFHHSLRVLLTGDADGYYRDFGRVADLAKAFGRPFVHDGTWSEFRGRRHGAPATDRAPEQFVVFAQNHDQVGNRALGDRLPAPARPLAALCVLCAPFTPMLFMGEEYGEMAPFQFFTDHIDAFIAEATREGRRREFAAFAEFSGEEVPDPQALETFERSRLTGREDGELAALYRRLLALRRELRLAGREARATFDEGARWLSVDLGGCTLAASFAREPQTVPAAGTEILVAAGEASLGEGGVRLGPLSGALLR